MFQGRIDLLQQKGLHRSLRSVRRVDRQCIEAENKRYTNYTSNDYLGLGQIASDKDDSESFMRKYNYHSLSPRLISGSPTVYKEIESILAGWLGYNTCTILNSGYDINLALFNISKNTNCAVFSDQESHVSITDGIKLSDLRKVIYKHLDVADLERGLAEYPNQNIQKIIISDSVFPTSGDIVSIGQLASLKHKYNATLVLDVSHSFGIGNYSNYQGVDILTSSLSKACGTYEGMILSSNDMKNMLINHGRPLIYSSNLPIYNLYFIKKNIEKLISVDDRRTELNSLSRYFNRKLEALNVNYSSSNSPIKLIKLNDTEVTGSTHQTLLKHHVFTSYLGYPTATKPVLRILSSYFYIKRDIDRLFEISRQEDRGGRHV